LYFILANILSGIEFFALQMLVISKCGFALVAMVKFNMMCKPKLPYTLTSNMLASAGNPTGLRAIEAAC
jgi:hypothetical protein